MEASPEGAEIIQGRIVGASDGGKIRETLRTTRTIDRFAKFFPFFFGASELFSTCFPEERGPWHETF